MFKKKSKDPVEITSIPSNTGIDVSPEMIKNGTPTIHDLIAPPSFDASDPNYLKIGDKYVRNFLIAGFPKQIGVGWLSKLYDYSGDLDLAIHVSPMDERTALDELTSKITQFQAQLSTEIEKGSNRNITKLQTQIAELVEERRKAEQNYISLFGIQMTFNLYCNNIEVLDKETQLLDSSLRGSKTKLMPSYLRQTQGYKSALPFGKSWMPRNYRNFSSEGLTACFPFYNAEISHPSGVFLGVNTQTQTPIYIDFYDRKLLNSGNSSVFGTTGSGKSFLVSLLTMRSTLKGIRTAIIDPEGEYKPITEALGGVNVEIKPGGKIPNPFDIQEEDETDTNDKPTGVKIVRIKEKVTDLVRLMGVMAKSLTPEQESLLSSVIEQTYRNFNITEDPESLYDNKLQLNEAGELVHSGQKVVMPTMTDFHNNLVAASREQGQECLIPIANTLRMFTKSGTLGLFDTQTPPELENLKDVPVVNFDVSFLNDDKLRPIGMFIALSWCSDKFAKQDIGVKKRIVCDEAWMMVKPSMPGSEYTSHFLETVARRIRKKNGALMVASQGFKEFMESPQGRAVLANSHVKIFLMQNETDLDAVQDAFKLSDGETQFLQTCKKGNFLLKMSSESSTGYALPFEYEKKLIEKNSTAKILAGASQQ